jgi:hypothetical protein
VTTILLYSKKQRLSHPVKELGAAVN